MCGAICGDKVRVQRAPRREQGGEVRGEQDSKANFIRRESELEGVCRREACDACTEGKDKEFRSKGGREGFNNGVRENTEIILKGMGQANAREGPNWLRCCCRNVMSGHFMQASSDDFRSL